MWITIGLVIFYLLAPVALIYLCRISRPLKKIGVIVLAYALGLILGNSGILPTPGSALQNILDQTSSHYLSETELLKFKISERLTESDLMVNQIHFLQEMLWTIIIPLAIPLLLFSLDLKKWLKLAQETLISLILAMISLIIVVFAGYYLFKNSIEEPGNVAGMLVGVYTGGSVNLAAIGAGLKVKQELLILTNTSDLVIGSIALLFLMTVAQRLFHKFLPKFSSAQKGKNEFQYRNNETFNDENDIEKYEDLLKRKYFFDMLKALGLAILIFALSVGISLLLPKLDQGVVVISSVTTLGLIASLFKSINKIKNSFQLGMYLILIFSLILSSMANLFDLINNDTLFIFLYVLLVVFGSMAIHVGLAAIFKIDTDTTIIAITALTYSPPFVPAVASAIKNKEVIISGLAIGIMGFVFGTELGLAFGKLLE